MNNVSLIGNLATDVELRDVGEDKKVAGFLLAVNRGSREAGADFVWVQAWDRQAELCAEYLTKGQQVGVAGRIRSRSWEEDGKRRTVVEVVGHRVDFLSPPREDGAAPRGDEGAEVIPFEAAAAG
jgi:single-strand DNA-binding protein